MSAAARDDALSCPLLRNIRSGSCIACICRGIEGSVHGKKCTLSKKSGTAPALSSFLPHNSCHGRMMAK